MHSSEMAEANIPPLLRGFYSISVTVHPKITKLDWLENIAGLLPIDVADDDDDDYDDDAGCIISSNHRIFHSHFDTLFMKYNRMPKHMHHIMENGMKNFFFSRLFF